MALRVVKPDVRGARPHEVPAFDLLGFALLAVGLAGVLGSLEFVSRGLLRLAGADRDGRRSVSAPLAGYAIHNRRQHRAADRFPDRCASAPSAPSILGGLPLRIAIGASPFLLPLMLQIGFGLSPLHLGPPDDGHRDRLAQHPHGGRAGDPHGRLPFRLLIWASVLDEPLLHGRMACSRRTRRMC